MTITEESRYERQKHDEKVELDRVISDTINDFRKELLNKFIKNYSEVKKIRRLLRAKCVSLDTIPNQKTEIINSAIYDLYLQDLNKTQLELESLKQEIRTSKESSSYVFSDPKNLDRHISSMENYLRQLIKEYENNLRHFNGDSSTLPLNKLPLLESFIKASSNDSDFNKKFVDEYHLALKSLRNDLLKVVVTKT